MMSEHRIPAEDGSSAGGPRVPSDVRPRVQPRDYLRVDGGLYFAVLSEVPEQGRVLAMLRYRRSSQGDWHKFRADEADRFLRQHRPACLWHSDTRDVSLHAVAESDIRQIFKPCQYVRALIQAGGSDGKTRTAHRLLTSLMMHGIEQRYIGITGSLLIGAHTRHSDIDLVVYGRQLFFRVRSALRDLLQQGVVTTLTGADWLETWRRRGCELGLSSYVEHERRKGTKFMCQGSRVDVSMSPLPGEAVKDSGQWKKRGFRHLDTIVREDRYRFDYPARYGLQHGEIPELVCYTASYVGQARKGERIHAAGWVEVDAQGHKRLLVGSSREAKGEYVRVLP